jgi:cullin 3
MRHSGRKLVVNPGLGSADIRAKFYPPPPDKMTNYTIHVTTYQMCILDLFNSFDELTFEEILTKTEISNSRDVEEALQILAMGKLSQRILSKTPHNHKSKTIDPTDVFKVNETFTSKTER